MEVKHVFVHILETDTLDWAGFFGLFSTWRLKGGPRTCDGLMNVNHIRVVCRQVALCLNLSLKKKKGDIRAFNEPSLWFCSKVVQTIL